MIVIDILGLLCALLGFILWVYSYASGGSPWVYSLILLFIGVAGNSYFLACHLHELQEKMKG